jgi:hypothetical protein
VLRQAAEKTGEVVGDGTRKATHPQRARIESSDRRAGQMSLDLADGLLGKILVDFGDDKRLNVGMEGASQIGQGPWWRYHHKGGDPFLPDHLLHPGCDLPGEPMLLDVVPVGGSTALR